MYGLRELFMSLVIRKFDLLLSNQWKNIKYPIFIINRRFILAFYFMNLYIYIDQEKTALIY